MLLPFLSFFVGYKIFNMADIKIAVILFLLYIKEHKFLLNTKK